MARKTTFAATVSDGDRLAALVALRDLIADSLAESPPYTRAALCRQLRELLVEIDAVKPAEVNDPVDDLAAARAVRLAEAQARKVPAKRGHGRTGSG